MAARVDRLKDMRKLDLHAWGANSYGQLANGTTEDVPVPSVVALTAGVTELLRVSTPIGGGGHTFLLTESGRLFACGWNNRGQLGLPGQQDEGQEVREFTRLQEVTALGQAKVMQVAAGWDSSFALTDNGQLWSWGSNVFGQLGRPKVEQHTSLAGQVEVGEQIIGVSAGLRHTLALTACGAVFSWGSGRKGQLGWLREGQTVARAGTPTRVTLDSRDKERVVQVAAGAYHSVAVTDEGSVYVWGNNKHGQITKGPSAVPNAPLPHKVAAGTFGGHKVLRVYTGWTHILALTEKGQLYSWGRNSYGELGRNSEIPSHDPSPGVIRDIQHPKQIACGSEHNLALLKDGTIWSWGWNEHGICGTGDESDVSTPRRMDLLSSYNILQIGCGNGHSFVIGSLR